jgi:hypothetical protein
MNHQQQPDVVDTEAKSNAWGWLLAALIALLCLPSSLLAILWFVRLSLRSQSFGHFTFAVFFAPYLISAAFGPYILALAFVLWLFQISMGPWRISVKVSSVFLILAIIGLLARESSMR